MKLLLCLAALAATAACAEPQALFNGRDLSGWKNAYPGDGGAVKALSNGVVECGIGNPLSGIVYTNAPLTMNYELSLEGMRVEGSDFFIALTIPVVTNYCTVDRKSTRLNSSH